MKMTICVDLILVDNDCLCGYRYTSFKYSVIKHSELQRLNVYRKNVKSRFKILKMLNVLKC